MRTLDSLILDQISGGADAGSLTTADTILVCDDPTGDLTAAACGSGRRVVVLDSDYSRCQRAISLGAQIAGDRRLDEFLAGSNGSAVAVGEMPKSLSRLDYLARSIAGAGFDTVTCVFGANNKHLARSMNETLATSFEEVSASRGRGKFRCLVATGPRNVTYEPAAGDGLVAVGGVFSGARADHGGELLRSALPAQLGRFLDLGCGNGSVSRGLDGDITATDSDADAVLSARAIGLSTTWDDAGSRFPAGTFDTIALNPPFHAGTTVDATLVSSLLDASARLLAPGGCLYLVHNSHLRYRPEVERRLGSVEQVARNQRYTVLRATAR
ncbi:Ribosomal RNA large subunit methyltransferase G [Corynebacterium capitovis DSM 44611]|uniref:class I SAM-dependent methyltransferase n=1 Tax=Corynebacterium capitovis TaxID=131081 RepID=UPI000366ACEA|nr:methyltransferase [Corynebacterium capitovis]WKD57467.1 Ribosomal RNA large subunit methyltransferase G [Corynebacterium capitovis DSM 44611]